MILVRRAFIAQLTVAATIPVQRASAQTAPAKLTDIDHIVILMQENRSFDHYFGTMRGVRGYGDPRLRNRDAVRADLESGKISESAARDEYGL